MPVLQIFFVLLLLTTFALFYFVRRLPEKTGPVDPLLQGGWLLRPFRGVGNLISFVERSPAKPESAAPTKPE